MGKENPLDGLKQTEKKKLLAFFLSFISGAFLFIQGLKFTVFGFFLSFGIPIAGVVFIFVGLLGLSICVGSLMIWNDKMIEGGTVVIIFSSFSILKGFSPFILSGLLGGSLALWDEIRDVSKKKMITVAVVLMLSSAVLISGAIHYKDLSSRYRHIEVNGEERRYLIHIPSGHSGDAPVPLLMALHGGGGSAVSMKQKSDFDSIADRKGFIVVYPDGSGSNQHYLHTWNTGFLNNYAEKRGVNDTGFLTMLIEEIEGMYNINRSRIYMTGHSNGGRMTYRFASEHPELLSGIAPVSSSVGVREDEQAAPVTIPEPEGPLSVVHVHGREDETVPYYGGRGSSVLGTRYDLSVNESISFWVENNNCSEGPRIEESKNGGIEMKRYEGGDENTTVSLITINDAGHFWDDMNGEVRSSEDCSDALAELIWTELEAR